LPHRDSCLNFIFQESSVEIRSQPIFVLIKSFKVNQLKEQSQVFNILILTGRFNPQVQQ